MASINEYVHERKMAKFSMKRDIEKLKQFLQSEDYTNSHPQDQDFKELIEAMDNLVAMKRVKAALEVFKTAMSEEGWLRGVLKEHKDTNAAYFEPFELCVHLYDTTRFMSSDCEPPYRRLKWKQMDPNDENDGEAEIEICLYCDFRRKLSYYVQFMDSRFLLEGIYNLMGEDATVYRKTWEALKTEINKFPTETGMYSVTFTAQPKYFYNKSYLQMSETDRFSRSVLLANLPNVMRELTTCKQMFAHALPNHDTSRQDRIYNRIFEKYKAWEEKAAEELQRIVLASAAMDREIGVTKRFMRPLSKKPRVGGGGGLSQLLDELAALNDVGGECR
jgi:hypothetical protein